MEIHDFFTRLIRDRYTSKSDILSSPEISTIIVICSSCVLILFCRGYTSDTIFENLFREGHHHKWESCIQKVSTSCTISCRGCIFKSSNSSSIIIYFCDHMAKLPFSIGEVHLRKFESRRELSDTHQMRYREIRIIIRKNI